MILDQQLIEKHNNKLEKKHNRAFEFISQDIDDVEELIAKLQKFQIGIPSWALGTGGTRFGRFSGPGEPGSLEQKFEDVGLLHALNKSSGAISLHIPWDIPEDTARMKELARSLNITFDAVNSNTFQDQPQQEHSYKYGSLHHVDPKVRKQAIDHNIEVINYGKALGSKALTVWLADGSSFPGQLNFREAFQNTLSSLQEIYKHLPEDWKLFIEYKAFEPYFYSMTIGDWGQSLLLANKLGPKAYTLVDLGHHLPNANIEQIVSLLLMEGKLGGFHFNDSKYADDDLTAGSIKPYQLFLIFNELIDGMDLNGMEHATGLGWMIDASHNLKDPLVDLLQSVEAIKIAYAQALLIDRVALKAAQQANDVVKSQEILQDAFRTDVRPLVAESRLRSGAALNPLLLFEEEKLRDKLIAERGLRTIATGL
ncbi:MULTISPECIES: TIM barrel protein [unclassified Sphingobacterium]|uniref:TIM barrel protein n=1 Tax=unclassified Sphingobacterium TaxID=2609468 RepID=UPI00104E4F91|nr:MULTISPECIES: TIM barrel protein [unclassified Sphingobacterium]MCS3553203.1 L-rhamnose isomerase/sugar isomerase [Sphingobacterium sp. JUb21]TCR09587.1 L-rhamnose isomerase/sugar isomerase [Sphingobacterium sp. JUb20]